MIPLADLLVWPVNMETNDAGDPIRIPFTAFHSARGMAWTSRTTPSARGAPSFTIEVAKITAPVVRVSQM